MKSIQNIQTKDLVVQILREEDTGVGVISYHGRCGG